MKRSSTWFALILIASALLLSGAQNVSADSPSPRPTAKPNESAGLANDKRKRQVAPVSAPNLSQPAPDTGASSNKEEDGSDTSTKVIAFFTVITAFATIAIAKFSKQLVSVTAQMTKATEAAAEAARLALHANRPYLHLSRISDDRHKDTLLGKQHPISRAVISFHNYGNGPAEILKLIATSSKFDVGDGTEPKWAKLLADEPRKLHIPIVGPDQELGPFSVNVHWTSDDIDLVESGHRRVAIYGIVEYRGDAPTEPYYTRFFWWFCPITMPNIQRADSPELNERT